MASARSHIWNALRFGWTAGLLIGLVDAVGRIAVGRFESYEIYLCLLLPALVLACVFFVIGSLLCISKLFRDQSSVRASWIYTMIFGCLVWAVAFGVNAAKDPTIIGVGGASLILLGVVVVLSRGAARSALVQFVHQLRIASILQAFSLAASCFVALNLGLDLYEQRRMSPAAPGPEKTAGLPNIVFITLDTVRADHLPCYGYARATAPELCKLAASGALFEKVISPTSWTLPSHASMFTGREIEKHRADTDSPLLPDAETTLAEILHAHGYQTAGFVGGPYVKRRYGMGQGFDLYRDRLDFFEFHTFYEKLSIRRLLDYLAPNLTLRLLRTNGERSSAEMNTDIFRYLDGHRGASFFLFVNYFDAHDPYDSASEFQSQFVTHALPYEEVDRTIKGHYYDAVARYEPTVPEPALKQFMIDLYDSEIRLIDQRFSELIDYFRKNELFKNTLFIVTSDHGEEFFDHGGVQHRQTLYGEVLNVPLFFVWEGKITPHRVNSQAGSIDIFATVLDLLQIPIPEKIDSVSLKPLIDGIAKLPHPPIRSSLKGNPSFGGVDMAAVTDQGMKLIVAAAERPRIPNALFDNASDPLENDNLYPKAEYFKKRERLQKLLPSRTLPP